MRAAVSGLSVLTVPVSLASPAITFQRVPELNVPIVTTAVSTGETSRLTRVCSPSTIAAPATSASTQCSGCAAWPPTPLTSISNLSVPAMHGPEMRPIRPAGTSDQTCIAKQASTPSSAPWAIMESAPSPDSSAGWKASLTTPPHSSRVSCSTSAAVSSIAVWQSCPQACMTPGLQLAKEAPVVSVTGSASMSARRRTVLPGFAPRISASVPV